MKKIFLIATLAIAFKSKALESCFPKNDLKFYKENKSLEGITESEFNNLISRVKLVMGPIVKQQTNKDLIINGLWANPTVDANATRDANLNPVINLNGGIARHPNMTRDGLLLILCHEVGHHLGGAPKAFRGTSTIRGWSSAEGEADYFATTKCLPKIYNEDLDTKNLDLEIDTINLKMAMGKCKDDTCTRIVLAGKAVSDVFASLKVGTPEPKIGLKDQVIADKTIYNHPNPQCRLDTFIAGARCDVSTEIGFDNTDPKVGACANNSEGARPTCWFKESEFN